MLTNDVPRVNETSHVNYRSPSLHLTSYHPKYHHIPKEIPLECCWGTYLHSAYLSEKGQNRKKRLRRSDFLCSTKR